ncbi:enoyl-CoA hydratase/isomerase family protein, partial [bacterium]
MGFETIIYEKRAPIAFVTLNRPEKLNALSQQLQAEVREALEDAGWADDAIRVIVLKANGRAFSAGFDLSGGGGPSNAHTIRRSFMQGKGFSASAWWEVFWGNPKPIIAQVHGFCIAGGCATASFCDLRVASEDALFGAPEIRTGGPYV